MENVLLFKLSTARSLRCVAMWRSWAIQPHLNAVKLSTMSLGIIFRLPITTGFMEAQTSLNIVSHFSINLKVPTLLNVLQISQLLIWRQTNASPALQMLPTSTLEAESVNLPAKVKISSLLLLTINAITIEHVKRVIILMKKHTNAKKILELTPVALRIDLFGTQRHSHATSVTIQLHILTQIFSHVGHALKIKNGRHTQNNASINH